MLPIDEGGVVAFPTSARPRLLFIIDAEEEFDWSAPFSRDSISVTNISAQAQPQAIFARYGIRPTYAIDYPVATDKKAIEQLSELCQSGACEIGAQLHTWVTPPYDEPLSERNSFANNLPTDLELRKVQRLTQAIEENFGCAPKVYRAGRYGAGASTPAILQDLGYEIDCSVLPGIPSAPFAPDYTLAPGRPYWLASTNALLEIPVTIGDVGFARHLGKGMERVLLSSVGRRVKLPAIAARTRAWNRVRLTPEGSTLKECKRLTRALLSDGYRVFVVSYHTPSLLPGRTPYVKNNEELQRFLKWIDGYCEFFMTEALGAPSTPTAVRQWALDLSGQRHANI